MSDYLLSTLGVYGLPVLFGALLFVTAVVLGALLFKYLREPDAE